MQFKIYFLHHLISYHYNTVSLTSQKKYLYSNFFPGTFLTLLIAIETLVIYWKLIELKPFPDFVMAVTTNRDASPSSATNAANLVDDSSLPLKGAHRSKAIEEARSHLVKADRATKPTVTRWKAKLSTAGDEYCKAAILFYRVREMYIAA